MGVFDDASRGHDCSVLLAAPPGFRARRRVHARIASAIRRECRGDARHAARRRGAQRRSHAVSRARHRRTRSTICCSRTRCSTASKRRSRGSSKRPKQLQPVFIVGAPVRRNDRLYNCGVVISRGRILGVTPKSFLPNYREYYENRWFAPGIDIDGPRGRRSPGRPCRSAPISCSRRPICRDFVFHLEICEDFWAADPPSTQGALAGALILCNLSASNIVVGKARRSRRAVRVAVDALPRRVRVLRGGSRREHDRSRVGRPGDDPRARRAARAAPSASRRRARWRSPTSTSSACGSSACAR